VFRLEKLSQLQIMQKHVNIFSFSFKYYKLQLFFKQHIHRITFACRKIFMNFFKTLNFDFKKLEKYEIFIYFYMRMIIPYYYQKK